MAHRIFVVEDNPGDLRLLREALCLYSVECELVHYETAVEAMQALDAIEAGRDRVPHLILLDFNVPGGDARDILEAVAGNSSLKDVPVAVISSSVAPLDREQSLRLGARCFLIKPIGLDEFLSEVGGTVARLLELPEDKLLGAKSGAEASYGVPGG